MAKLWKSYWITRSALVPEKVSYFVFSIIGKGKWKKKKELDKILGTELVD